MIAVVCLLGIPWDPSGPANQVAGTGRTTGVRQQRHARSAGAAHRQGPRPCGTGEPGGKSRFLTGITHELRTPLHGILGYAELLRLEGGLNPTQSERVAAMIAAGEHLLGMINSRARCCRRSKRIGWNWASGRGDRTHRSLPAPAWTWCVPAAATKGLDLVLAIGAPGRLFADPTRLQAGADQPAWQCDEIHLFRLDRVARLEQQAESKGGSGSGSR